MVKSKILMLALLLGLSLQIKAADNKQAQSSEEEISKANNEVVKADPSFEDTVVLEEDKLVSLRSGVFYPERLVKTREKSLMDLRKSNPDSYAFLIGLCKGNKGLLSDDNKTLLIQLGFLKWDGTVFEDVQEVVRSGSPREDSLFEWQSPIEKE